MRLIRVAGLVVVIVLTVVALQAAVAAYEPEGAAAEDSRVWIDPPRLSVDEGDTFTVTVMVENAQDMVGYEFKMGWESSVLTVTDVTDAGFLLEDPTTSLNISPGTLTFEVFLLPPYEDGADGDGALAVMTLEAVGTGVSKLNLDDNDVRWYDANDPGTPHTPTVDDGRVTVGLDFSVYLPLTSKNYGP